MRWIVAGSRKFTDEEHVFSILADYANKLGVPEEIVTGGAKGVDELGKSWAKANKIKNTEFKADWDAYGKSAGPIRNKKMAQYVSPDGILILIWNGKSKGSANMKMNALLTGLKIYETIVTVD